MLLYLLTYLRRMLFLPSDDEIEMDSIEKYNNDSDKCTSKFHQKENGGFVSKEVDKSTSTCTTLAVIISPASTLTTTDYNIEQANNDANLHHAATTRTQSTPSQCQHQAISFMTPMAIRCSTIDSAQLENRSSSSSSLSKLYTSLNLSDQGSFQTAKSSLVPIPPHVSPVRNANITKSATSKKNNHTPEGLKPRNMVRIKSQLKIPNGLKPRKSLSEIRAILGLEEETRPNSNVLVQSKKEGQVQEGNIQKRKRSRTCKEPNETNHHEREQLFYQNHNKCDQRIFTKQMNVSFASPEVTQPSMSSNHGQHKHTSSPTRPIHLGKTVKKSNVSLTSSSLTDRSRSMSSKYSSNSSSLPPPLHHHNGNDADANFNSSRLSIDQAKTAVGAVVATSLNESSILRDVSGISSSIKMNDSNDEYGLAYDRYLNVEMSSFLPTDESARKSRNKIKAVQSNDYHADYEDDKYEEYDDERLSISYAAFDDSQSQVRPQRIDHSSCSSEDEARNSSFNSSRDDWHQYEQYKKEEERKEEEQITETEIWDMYERYKVEQEEAEHQRREIKKSYMNQSRDSYSSRDHLFSGPGGVTKDHYDKQTVGGYDFSPVTEMDQNNQGHEQRYHFHDPFLVDKGETSFISDISHSSVTRHEYQSARPIMNSLRSQADSALSGPSYHPKKEISFGPLTKSFLPSAQYNSYDEFIAREEAESDVELNIIPVKRHEKELMVIEIVRRLKDNLALVIDVESTIVDSVESIENIHNPLIGTYTDKVRLF